MAGAGAEEPANRTPRGGGARLSKETLGNGDYARGNGDYAKVVTAIPPRSRSSRQMLGQRRLRQRILKLRLRQVNAR